MATLSIQNNKKKIKLGRYAGQWVAFVQGKVIASNESLKNLMREVDRRKLRRKAVVFLVPRKDEGPYILFVV